tara:strand:+ start:397 stop:840 length:444 start_codon:yes stop_codon:yes gene_type:complete
MVGQAVGHHQFNYLSFKKLIFLKGNNQQGIEMANKITVVDWIPYDEADALDSNFGGLGGFFKEGMRWNDYINAFPQESHKYAEALREAILKRKIDISGRDHQNSELCNAPKFSDGTASTFSYRAWGDLLGAVWSEEENEDYNYMDFY